MCGGVHRRRPTGTGTDTGPPMLWACLGAARAGWWPGRMRLEYIVGRLAHQPDPAGSTSTTSGGGDPSPEVLAAYRGMWADLVTAARTSDFQSPLLAQLRHRRGPHPLRAGPGQRPAARHRHPRGTRPSIPGSPR